MAGFGLNIKGEDTFYGDIGRVDTNPNLSGPRSYVFQVGKGNNATAGASDDPLAQVGKYLPTIILGFAAVIGAVVIFGGRKK